MDKLGVLQKAQRLGGNERREAIEQLMRDAHDMGFTSEVGGGKAGGINFRYGSIRYAVIDVTTKGDVKLYVQLHPNKKPPQEISDRLNGYIGDHEALKPKSFPIGSYGYLENRLEEIPHDDLLGYMELAVDSIRELYYRPHLG